MKKIAVIGAESTGKSMLCKQLAKHFNGVCVPEVAREIIGSLTRPYTLDDILIIEKEQLKRLHAAAIGQHPFVFCDTESIINKIWCLDVFGEVPPLIEQNIRVAFFDHYLLLKPDIPWHPDPLRENPHRRKYLHNCYLQELERQGFMYSEIYGTGESRLKLAREAVGNLSSQVEP